MPERSLAAAARATSRTSHNDSARGDDAGRILLEAIKNSTTGMDQIVLRRIGFDEKPPKNLK
ncbi:MAG: hypothetical protein JSU95_12965 [Betaproteobacteria bacterium]|nr:MAG: hypothetical protein JSU95_12965 [Betaproteobacteria bacterium]